MKEIQKEMELWIKEFQIGTVSEIDIENMYRDYIKEHPEEELE